MEIPKFVYHKENSVSIWYFESEYCQSKFGPYSSTGTNSCTLIALLAANYIAKKRLDVLDENFPFLIMFYFDYRLHQEDQDFLQKLWTSLANQLMMEIKLMENC